jgi:hypothetical protein
MKFGGTPVRGHLPTPGSAVGSGTDRLEKHVFSSHSERQGKGSVAIIRVKPIVARAEGHGGSDLDGFMAGCADLEVDFVLPLEQDFTVVDAP